MKIRTSFVSNSSSSSFVVAFKKIPRTIKEIQEMLFKPGQELYSSPYTENTWPVEEIAGIVFGDMKGKLPLTVFEISELASECSDVDSEDFLLPGEKKYGQVDWPKYEAACKEAGQKIGQEFIDKNSDSYFFEFEYADENGAQGSAMEHGDLFEQMPYFRISHH
jgi:hypothetical protein